MRKWVGLYGESENKDDDVDEDEGRRMLRNPQGEREGENVEDDDGE